MIKDSPIGALITDPANKELISSLSPAEISKLKDADGNWLDPETIKRQFSAAKALAADTRMKKFFGITQEGKFLTAEELEVLEANKQLFDDIKQNYPWWLADDKFQKASFETKRAFAANPSRFKEYQTLERLKNEINANVRGDANTLATAMFGYNLESMEVNFYEAQRQAKLGNVSAQAQLAAFKSLFGGDGNPVSGFWKTAGQLLSSLDSQNIDSAAAGNARSIINAIQNVRQAKFNTLPPARSIYGGEVSPNGVDMNVFYQTVQDVTHGHPLNYHHFKELIKRTLPMIPSNITDPEERANKALATVFDELAYAVKDTNETSVPRFPQSWEEAENKFNLFVKPNLPGFAKQPDLNEVRAAEEKRKKEADRKAIAKQFANLPIDLPQAGVANLPGYTRGIE